MNKIKTKIISIFVNSNANNFWKMSGNIAERFHKKDLAEYDDLQERLYYWITEGIKDFK